MLITLFGIRYFLMFWMWLFILAGTILICSVAFWQWHRLGFIDTPVARSSHKIPTPTAAGLVFITIFNICCLLLPNSARHAGFNLVFVALSLILGIVCWIDDVKKPIPSGWRLLVQLLAAAVLAYQYDYESLFSYIIWVIAVISILNAANFLDGINSFWAIQWLYLSLFLSSNDWLGLNILQAIVLAYLLFNVRGRIFMGDTGSVFLGLVITALMLNNAHFNTAHSIVFAKYVNYYFWGDQQLLLIGSAALLCWADITATLTLRFVTKIGILTPRRDYLFNYLQSKYQMPGLIVALLYVSFNLMFFYINEHVIKQFNQPYTTIGTYFVLYLVLCVCRYKTFLKN